MKYSTFEELPVWKAAVNFALSVFELTEKAECSKVSAIRKTNLNGHRFRSQIILQKDLREEQPLNLYNFFTLPAVQRVNPDRCFVYAKASTVSQISNLKFQI